MLRGEKGPFENPIGFKGLSAPRWDEAASHFPGDENWKIEDEQVSKGRELYGTLCSECHNGPLRDSAIPIDDPRSFWNQKNWVQGKDELLFDNTQKPVVAMGTDPEQARVLTERTVKLPTYLGVDTGALLEGCGMQKDPAFEKSYALSLMDVVARVRERHILDTEKRLGRPLTDAEKLAIRGTRANCPNPRVFPLARIENTDLVQNVADNGPSFYVARPHYRARPLDGIWATAPYLHNGSVPTLDDLLSPQHSRPTTFCVGPMQFDPKRVGLARSPEGEDGAICEAGLTRFDATKRGNSNLGHSFEGDGTKLPYGIIGRGLSPEERAQLIAYLKTL
ncbi:hypothetical protein D9M68_281720 [compost metagenome]